MAYVENPEKTQGLSGVIGYAAKEGKTTAKEADGNRRYVAGINCTPATAYEEMSAVKRRFGKMGGIVAYHGYQSFAPGEATPQIVHEIGLKLAEEVWGDRYQVLVATHLDKANHLHNHLVVNSISFVDGLRYRRTKQDYHRMRTVSDRLCREYGLSVIERPHHGQSKHYGEWRAEQEGRPTYRGLVKAEIDEAIRQSMTERQFFRSLEKKGYEVKFGKDLTVRPPGKPRGLKLCRNFGEEYSMEGIRRRILAQGAMLPLPAEKKPPKVIYRNYKMNGKVSRKITGFRALYFHYCYKLGLFPRKPSKQQRTHFLLKEDWLKMEQFSQEIRLLSAHRIDTAEQLSFYQTDLEEKINRLVSQRKTLYQKRRTKPVMEDNGLSFTIKSQISGLTAQLKSLRREARLCEDIASRIPLIKERLRTVQQPKTFQTKEVIQDECIR